MLKIGKLTDYALLIVSEMAKNPQLILSASFLADTLHLSSPTVSKILKILAEGHIVNSVRGPEGGYRLSRTAEEISVVDIIRAMEGDFAMTECCENISHCGLHSVCTLRSNWQTINQKIHSFLASLSIKDMLEPLTLPTRV